MEYVVLVIRLIGVVAPFGCIVWCMVLHSKFVDLSDRMGCLRTQINKQKPDINFLDEQQWKLAGGKYGWVFADKVAQRITPY